MYLNIMVSEMLKFFNLFKKSFQSSVRTKKLLSDPNFFEEGYLTLYPDVAKSKMTGYEHYIKFGKREGRCKGWPTKFQFNKEEYLIEYSDVRNCGIDPWIHYVKYGKKEGRSSFAPPKKNLKTVNFCYPKINRFYNFIGLSIIVCI